MFRRGVPDAKLEKRYNRAIENYEFGPLKVDWSKVSEMCDGVLFDPYYHIRNSLTTAWYGGIDVPSVCVFDPKCIVNWNKITL